MAQFDQEGPPSLPLTGPEKFLASQIQGTADETVNPTTTNIAQYVLIYLANSGATVTFSGQANFDELVTFSIVPSFPSAAQNTVFAGPSGGAGIPSFRTLASSDISSALGGSPIPVLATVAALQAATSATLPGSIVYVESFSTVGDGGEGTFAVNTTTTANNGTIFNDASGRSWYRLHNHNPVNAKWFGAAGNGTTDDTAAIIAWLNLSVTLGSGYLPPGNYLVSSGIVVDLYNAATGGVKIFGAGGDVSVITSSYAGAGYPFKFNVVESPYTTQSFELIDIGFVGNTTTATLQIGNATVEGGISNFNIDVWATNNNTGASASAMTLNNLYQGKLNAVATTQGGASGAAVLIGQVQNTVFTGQFEAPNGGISVYFPASSANSSSNLFNNLYMSGATNVEISNASASKNTFNGGSFNFTANGINSTAGVSASGGSNYFINPSFSTASSGTFLASSPHGIVIKSTIDPIATPAVPATTVAAQNTTGQVVACYISGGAVTSIALSSDNGPTTNISVVSGQSSFVTIRPMDTIALTYTSAPTWVWRSVP